MWFTYQTCFRSKPCEEVARQRKIFGVGNFLAVWLDFTFSNHMIMLQSAVSMSVWKVEWKNKRLEVCVFEPAAGIDTGLEKIPIFPPVFHFFFFLNSVGLTKIQWFLFVHQGCEAPHKSSDIPPGLLFELQATSRSQKSFIQPRFTLISIKS